MVLVDADVMIDLMSGFPGAVAWMTSVAEPVGIPGYAMLELIAGCGSAADVQRVNRETRPLRVVWPSRPHCERALNDFKRASPVTRSWRVRRPDRSHGDRVAPPASH